MGTSDDNDTLTVHAEPSGLETTTDAFERMQNELREPIKDLSRLSVGDRVLWDGRSKPLTVLDTSFGSHVMVEGPNGAIYRIEPGESEFRLGYRGGSVEGFGRVSHE